jgi:hypothetical protein
MTKNKASGLEDFARVRLASLLDQTVCWKPGKFDIVGLRSETAPLHGKLPQGRRKVSQGKIKS